MYETTLHEELIIVPVSRHQRLLRWPDGKVRGRISNLPSFSQLHADVMAVNLFFSSNGSNIVNFSTPEGGDFFSFLDLVISRERWYSVYIMLCLKC